MTTHDDHLVHTVAVSAVMGYALALWQMWIWYRRSWLTTLKSTIDSAIYAGITVCIFAWLW